jgi:hypothetical protein
MTKPRNSATFPAPRVHGCHGVAGAMKDIRRVKGLRVAILRQPDLSPARGVGGVITGTATRRPLAGPLNGSRPRTWRLRRRLPTFRTARSATSGRSRRRRTNRSGCSSSRPWRRPNIRPERPPGMCAAAQSLSVRDRWAGAAQALAEDQVLVPSRIVRDTVSEEGLAGGQAGHPAERGVRHALRQHLAIRPPPGPGGTSLLVAVLGEAEGDQAAVWRGLPPARATVRSRLSDRQSGTPGLVPLTKWRPRGRRPRP